MTERTEMNGCALAQTKYCRMLNMHACEYCTVRGLADMDRVKSELDLYESLLPEGGIAQLFLSHDCQFCKGEPKGQRRGYAILDMANPEPRRIQRRLIGNRMAEYGTMIPLQFAVCPRCRRRFLWIEYAPVLFPVAFGGAGLALLAADSVHDALASQASIAPFLVWFGIVIAGILLGLGAAALAKARYRNDMIVDVCEHPVVKQMLDKGWVFITRQSRTKLLFSKSRMAKGLGTASDETRD